jgi:hypothetical protein
MNRNPDLCDFCGEHRHSTRDHHDDVCDASPTGYHRFAGIETWRDSPFDRWDNLYDWATGVFERDGSFDHLPVGYRRALTRLWADYPNMPRGVSDPMYFANVLATELGIGDGRGKFLETAGIGEW